MMTNDQWFLILFWFLGMAFGFLFGFVIGRAARSEDRMIADEVRRKEKEKTGRRPVLPQGGSGTAPPTVGPKGGTGTPPRKPIIIEWKTLSEPGAAIEVKQAAIPEPFASAISRALNER